VSVNKPPSVIAAWQALYRHSKSPHSPLLSVLSGANIIIFIIIIMQHCREVTPGVRLTMKVPVNQKRLGRFALTESHVDKLSQRQLIDRTMHSSCHRRIRPQHNVFYNIALHTTLQHQYHVTSAHLRMRLSVNVQLPVDSPFGSDISHPHSSMLRPSASSITAEVAINVIDRSR